MDPIKPVRVRTYCRWRHNRTEQVRQHRRRRPRRRARSL